MSLDPNKAYHELMQTGADWADKHAAFHVLDSTTKSVLASCAKEHMERGDSAAKADTYARCDTRYTEHLTAVSAARKAELHAKVKYDSVRALVELRRTEAATLRSEMQLAGTQR